MQSIQLTTQVNADGFLQVKMPPELKNLPLDVLLLFQVLTSANTTPELVYPDGRFYGSCGQDPINIDNLGVDPNLDDDLDLVSGVA